MTTMLEASRYFQSICPVPLADIDLSGRIRNASSSFRDFLGYPEVAGMPVQELFADDTDAAGLLESACHDGTVRNHECTVKSVHARPVPVLLTIAAAPEAGGEPSGYWMFFLSVSPWKLAQRKYRCLVEMIPHIIYSLDTDGHFTFLNGAVNSMGYSPEELIGRHFSTIVHPDDFHAVSRKLVLPRYEGKTTGAEGAPKLFDERRSGLRATRDLEIRLIPKGCEEQTNDVEFLIGSLATSGDIHVELDASGMYELDAASRQKRFVGTVGIITDITARKRSENALRATEERFVSMAARIQDGLMIEEEGEVVYINERACEIFGYPREELAALSVVDLAAPEDRERAGSIMDEAERTGCYPSELELWVVRKDGTRVCVSNRYSFGMDGDCIRTRYVVSTDVTHKRIMEQEALNREKLESIALLAGGIAHDFNNLLTGVSANISLAYQMVEKESELAGLLEDANQAATRAAGLTQQLLAFAKGNPPVLETYSIAGIVRDSAVFALRGTKTRCEFDIPEDLWPAGVDKDQFFQVVGNLAINANQAMVDGGVFRIRAKNETLPIEEAHGKATRYFLKLSFEDKGKGIPRDQQSRIFDPFFSTKVYGHGLGLATTYSIVKKHGGWIVVDSVAGEGTTFHVYLPALPGETPRDVEPEVRHIVCGNGRILLMDDEELIRGAVGRMLQKLGYAVDAVNDGAQAVEIYAAALESGERYDAVILDLTVPGGMGGIATLEHLKAIDPQVRAIVSSGHSFDSSITDYRRYGFHAAAPKPFSVATLSRIVADVVGKRPSDECIP